MAVIRYLAGIEPSDGRTAFRDVRAVQPGSWVAFSTTGGSSSGRWFEPALLTGSTLRGPDAVDAVREAVGAALRSRTEGRRTGLTLSGGRDSGSLAVALAEAGVTTTCVTQVFDEDLPVGEQGLAQGLADRLQFPCVAAYVPSRPSRAELDEIPRWTGTPLGYRGFPQATAPVDVAAAAGVEVLLTGAGGEPLFSSAPVGVWDLIRSGDLRRARVTARTFHQRWIYPYPTIAKAGVRAILPPVMLGLRERARPVPPWVKGKVTYSYDERTAPRNAFEHLLTALRASGANDYEIEERLHQTRAIELAHPLLDLRVVKVACSVALEERVPAPEPKPLLTRAFLGDVAATRVKMRFNPYYQRLARHVQELDPAVFREGSTAERSGLVRKRGLPAVCEARWLTESLALLPVEMWLRSG
jgi:asparagine synthetase B (glutamine-hydrolysing)